MNHHFRQSDPAGLLSKKTIDSVGEFLESDIRGETSKDGKTSFEDCQRAEKLRSIPQFCLDGYGRWRERETFQRNESSCDGLLSKVGHKNRQNLIRMSKNTPSSRLSSSGDQPKRYDLYAYNKQNEQFCRSSDSSNSARRFGTSRTSTAGTIYKHLSTSLRSNVFPGVGKECWESSTKQTFVPKTLPPSWVGSEYEYGVKKDSFMEWSEQDVYRQRLMKAWDKYVTDIPKQEKTVFAGVPKKEKMKEKPATKQVKKKKIANKEVKQKSQEIQPKTEESQRNDIQPMRIEVKPAPSEESFWEFYEQPFEKT